METAVRKATRLDYNPPKQKHLQTLINLTYQSPRHAADIIDLLEKRLKENSWIIIFKVLITIHTLMRLGDGESTIIYVETRPSALDTSRLREKSSGVVHIQNIYLYTSYLEQKVIAFRQLKYDYVKNTMGSKFGKLRRLSVKDGLLKETIILQKQIGSLLKCNFILDDVDNNISLYAFRLLTEDLLALFQVINESIVNILEHYFAMEKTDARTSLEIYKRFAKQTEDTIAFLDRAKRLQHELHISIPEVKHAPLSLATALEEYLNDSNKQENTSIVQQQQQQVTTNNPEQPKELLDFFASLENEKANIFIQQPPPLQQLPMFPNAIETTQPIVSATSTATTTTTTTSTTGHNPFRSNTIDSSSMQQLTVVPSFQSPLSLQPSNSTNTQSNPFRSNTMPEISFSSPMQYSNNNSNNWMMQPSVGTTHNPFSNSPAPVLYNNPPIINTNTTSTPLLYNNPFAMTGQQQQQQQQQQWESSSKIF